VTVSVVNMIPNSFSDETNQDSEPNVAVDPATPTIIAGSAFTRDPDPNATHAPIYISSDGGTTWSLHSIVPYSDRITGDITLRFASTTNHLYVGYLALGSLPSDMAVARTADLTFTTEMDLISQVQSGDQPYIQAATPQAGPLAGKDCVYVGYCDGWATMHYCLDAAAAQPAFNTVVLEARGLQGGIGFNLPQVRTAVHASGVLYAAFHSVHSGVSHPVDVVVVRDDHWGSGASPFTALKDSTDAKPGQRAAKNVTISNAAFGQESGGGELSIVVDPNNAATVYLAWADDQAAGYTLHVRRSTDSGQSWPDELWTVPMAQNPALAVNSAGTLGFLFQRFVETQTGPRWETHFRYLVGSTGGDVLLATVPADTPQNTWGTYLGDYIDLMAVDKDFYGVFCANNTPDLANFPSNVAYQRNHHFPMKKLYALDGVTEVPISIDPFFVKVTGIEDRVRLLKFVYELAIDPLAILLPSDVYQRLIEKWYPHVPKVADIQTAAERMTEDEKGGRPGQGAADRRARQTGRSSVQ
jgi:hypothetical protein